MRTLAITQNVTVDGSIEMLGEWFDPQGQAGVDNSDLLDELHRQDAKADGFLVGRRTFEDLRGYWPQQAEDPTGISDYLNRVQKYVVSSTITDPQWRNSAVLSGDPVEDGLAWLSAQAKVRDARRLDRAFANALSCAGTSGCDETIHARRTAPRRRLA